LSHDAYLRRSSMSRRVWRPAPDGDPDTGTDPVIAGMHFHDLRHTHKTWLIEDDIPEIAQAKRLGHRVPGVGASSQRQTPAPRRSSPSPARRRPRRPIGAAPTAGAGWRSADRSGSSGTVSNVSGRHDAQITSTRPAASVQPCRTSDVLPTPASPDTSRAEAVPRTAASTNAC
jgi:hypothetical protein